jgi:hypothetical protein
MAAELLPQTLWQSGAHENTDRPLRQPFPKGTELSGCGTIATADPHTPRVVTRVRSRRRFDAVEGLLFAQEAGWKKRCK